VIPLSKQSISRSDILAVSKVLNSKFISRGKQVAKFEKVICKKVKSRYGVSVNSASSALLLSYLSLGVKKNDHVWSVPITFVSTISSCLHIGAKIDFVDINPKSYNICVKKLENKLKITPKKKIPKVLTIVHLAGYPCEQRKIFKLSKKYGFKIMEDASHALGTLNGKEPIGSCKWSDTCVLSFHPSKSITTGEGGMILTNDKKIYLDLMRLRNNGIEKQKLKYKKSFEGYYEIQKLGYNFWLTDFQAALGISQLKKLDLFIKKRNKIARIYDKHFSKMNLGIPIRNKKIISSYHLYILNLKNKYNYKKIFKRIIDNNIQINLHYIPVHTHPYFRENGFRLSQFPESENYSKNCISLPIYPDLTLSNQIKVIKTIKKALS
tara:strand:+ start:447 stop:1586 length:1140 start_codon:yes stop_codon:yes gene_type:complete